MKIPTCIFALLLSGYLGLYQGRLALWRSDAPLPEQIFQKTPDIYPEADQRALQKGIPFATEEELSRLLEDYLS